MQEELEIDTPSFKDYFSERSDCYAKYRPSYPDELFRFLASTARHHDAAWDCATGNGQAAVALARYFAAIVATDASQEQIDAAIQDSRVRYATARAENSGLQTSFFDLLTVGQAFHWFDESRFFAEAARVLRPDGVLALWSYQLCTVSPECDAIVYRLYEDIVGEFWPPERARVEKNYDDVILPGIEVATPPLQMSQTWCVDDMLGFLRTWSACKRYQATHKTDPVLQIAPHLQRAWGGDARQVQWPLNLKVRRLNS